MTNTFTLRARRSRTLPFAVLAAAGAIALTGCGADSDAATGQMGQGYVQGQGPGTGGGMPGASGEIAAVDGSTLQVQGSDAQTAVTYTDTTSISQEVGAALADVTVGSCVMVTAADGSESSETAVDAGTVRISEKADGSCAGGGFAGGQRPEGAPSDMPTDMPTAMPSDMPSGGPGGMGGTSGEVTAVSDSGFTVAATSRGSEETTSVSVTVGSDTTYTTTETATKSALVVGRCVTATGEADEAGAVTADRLTVSDPVDGECTAGFGRRGMMPGGAPSQDGASS
ncbi:hypothetical protein [Nocardioides luteus]|uniref:DUF5666 domain-containing protein n=1 Tax=Nocardioides luteus TaxID=1844 RepID=A0A1J4MZR0_9ACTN|nr:hypothetical protein [Nocardioides luteus]OIJ24747.1 hypothetical protein UG56_021490 [Nocardioides luteus]